MLWFWLALAAALFWALASLLEKHVAVSFKDPLVQLFFGGLLNSWAIVLLWLLFPISVPAPGLLFLLAGVALAYFIASYFYCRSVLVEEVSRVVALLYVNPLFVLVFAAVFLRENLVPHQYAAVFLLVAGAFLLSVKDVRKLRFREGALLALASAAFFALRNTGTKAATQSLDAVSVYFWMLCFGFIICLLFAILHFNRLASVLRRNPRGAAGAVLSHASNFVGWLFFVTAVSLGLVSLVTATTSFHVLFVFLAAVGLSLFKPKLLEEVVSKGVVLEKAVGVMLMVGGAVLLAV